jgi:hypothetical protein
MRGASGGEAEGLKMTVHGVEAGLEKGCRAGNMEMLNLHG